MAPGPLLPDSETRSQLKSKGLLAPSRAEQGNMLKQWSAASPTGHSD